MCVMMMLYKEWKKNNPNFWDTTFTGGQTQEVVQYVTRLLDMRLRNYYINDDEEFTEDYTSILKINEFRFYNELKKIIFKDLKINNQDELRQAKFYSTSATNDVSNTKNINNSTGQTDSNSTDETTGNTTSNTSGTSNSNGNSATNGNDRGRALNSNMPHSNVESSLSSDLDIPITWKYATGVSDTVGKSDTTSTNSNTVNDNTETRGNNVANTDSVSKTTAVSEDVSTGNAVSDTLNNSNNYKEFDIIKLADLQLINFDEPFTRLINEIVRYCMWYRHKDYDMV